MSVNVKRAGNFISITPVANVDWDSRDLYPHGMYLVSIQLQPSAEHDFVVIREGGPTGPEIFSYKDVNGSGGIKYFWQTKCHPYLRWADCLLADPAKVRIIIQLYEPNT